MAENINSGRLMTMGLLGENKQSSGSYVLSAAINGVLLLLLVIYGVQHYVVHVKAPETHLISYAISVAPTAPAVKVPVVKAPTVKIVVPPMMKAPALKAPVLAPVPVLSTVPVAPIAAAPKPPITPPLPPPNIVVSHPPAVKVGVFGAADVPPPVKATMTRTAAAPVVGAFGAAATTSTSSPHGNVVVGTGFGSTAAVKESSAHPQVTTAGFSSNIGSTAAPVKNQVTTISPTVSYVPHPTYTPEAKAKHIEGDVAVNVIFLANGQVQVLGIAHSLDPGLDNEALIIAQKIKFTPATRNNTPVDFPTVIHIKFQLS